MKIRLILILLFSLSIFNSCFEDNQQPNVVYSSINSIQVENDVWICISKSSKKYHSRQCRGFNKCTHERRQVKENEAKRMKYEKCKICYIHR
ncbi:MAG: hypothetical protein HC803_04850 [Saprospiraceae bacterium]|nr:hypothetical protein [Saprospiraceae bacterium]